MRRGSTFVAAALALLSLPGVAHADSPKIAAQALFEEGRKLVAEGRVAEGCPKLAESQKLDPAPGTQINLADCLERSGKTATAWVTYSEAAAAARSLGRADWEELATTRAAALEPRLTRLRIVVPPDAEAEGLVVTRDGTAVGRAEWDTAIPVDPGAHSVGASCDGRVAHRETVEVAPGPAVVVVRIPRLLPRPPPPPPPEARATGTAQRVVGIAVGGAGLLSGVAGIVLGVRAAQMNRDGRATCSGTVCPPDGAAKVQTARDLATASTVTFIGGGVLLAAGIVIYFTAPRAPRTANLQLLPQGVSLQGTF